jgi:hypothetical protein
VVFELVRLVMPLVLRQVTGLNEDSHPEVRATSIAGNW